jgi:predicted transposase YbfD/YdcC
MSAGVPSHDRFNAIVAAINAREFETCLLSWITALHEITSGQVIAIDGKTLRGSFDAASSKSAIHMVSAWATANHISLRQVVVDAKSNEITAIPKLLDLIEISGAIVTIDAMGCQTELVDKIVSKKADCCIAVKQNQPTLHAAITQHFDELIDADFCDTKVRQTATSEEGHGRVEQRHYAICPVPESVKALSRWKKVRAIGMATNITVRQGKEHTEIRYYILTRYVSGKRFADAVRSHWGLENSLHWQLDVTFREDTCRARKGHSDANLSVIRRFALSMLKNEKSEKLGIKNKRLLAAWDNEYLAKVLFGQ